jgi:hypothetical protein
MRQDEFEVVLKNVCEILTKEARDAIFHSSKEFEDRVRTVLQTLLAAVAEIDFSPHPQAFPDISIPRHLYSSLRRRSKIYYGR